MARKRLLFDRVVRWALTLMLALGFLVRSGSAANTPPRIYINEIQVSTTATDWEFFELRGTPGTDLTGLTLLVVESDFGSSSGTVDRAIDLSGHAIPADGFFLGISPTGASTYNVAGDMAIADNTFENNTTTFLLVSNFTGSVGSDLDANDDGVLDSRPWDALLDALNLHDGDYNDFTYQFPSVGPDGLYVPSGAFRCPDAPWGPYLIWYLFLDFDTPDGTPGAPNATHPACNFPNAPVLGDIDASGAITLADAILALQITAGFAKTITHWGVEIADIDGNVQVGLEEAVYCLQKVAGVR